MMLAGPTGFGAEGIGLCRTEHMFMAADRQPKMRAMIMASDEAGRRRALDELLPLQQSDFEGLFEAMKGWPVTIRLLDPPLHEFLPDRFELHEAIVRARLDRSQSLAGLEEQFDRVRSLEETNPMLGTRGVRLGVMHPEIYEMQVRAITRAAIAVKQRSAQAPRLEIMIPLVAYDRELELVRGRVLAVAEGGGPGVRNGLRRRHDDRAAARLRHRRSDRRVTPTSSRSAPTISRRRGSGCLRDDVEKGIVPRYVEEKIITTSPFQTIDEEGVGQLVAMAVERGRRTRPEIELGVCGEHGGDPSSIRFFHDVGLDYVSCSPFRLPIARVAAAQASIAAAAREPHSGDV